MAAANKLAGRNGSISYAGNTFHVTSWECDTTADALDATDSSSGYYREFIAGLLSGTLTAEANFDTSNTPAAAQIHQGNCLAFQGNLGSSTGGRIITGTVLITSLRYRNPIDGIVTISVSGNFTGSIVEPGE